MNHERARVLVVDDNVDLANNLAEVLNLSGTDASAVYTAEDALKRLDSRDFGLVVTDMRMPGMNGLELLWRVRATQPDVSVLVITAYAQDTQLEQARAAGALDVLPKPVDIARLKSLCGRALGSFRC